jgi:hypothetical protein
MNRVRNMTYVRNRKDYNCAGHGRNVIAITKMRFAAAPLRSAK